jgi:hypothetical protein
MFLSLNLFTLKNSDLRHNKEWAADATGDLIALTAINSKFKKCQKNAARNFISATLFYDHGKNQIQHA